MRLRVGVLAAGLMAGLGWWRPVLGEGLYESRTIVTGMDLRSRGAGMRLVLGQVLAKVSGNPGLVGDGRLAGVDAAGLAEGFAYVDRESNQPKHDEQGTRDRPYDLRVRFGAAGVEALLRGWGEAVWPLPRPALYVSIEIRPRVGDAIPMLADTDAAERHRGALLAAADRFGVDLVFPAEVDGVSAPDGMAVLEGRMGWSDEAFGWVGEWRLVWGGAEHRWGVRGVGFDAAYRDAAGGAARVLSGR